MKISITLKDPDGVYESIADAVRDSIADVEITSQREIDALTEVRIDEINKALGKWIEYGEYVRIDFDTDAGTATVRTVKE